MKRNGVYCARLVAKGFSQIPGVDFTDNYSPMVNDVTFRVVVVRMLIQNLKGKVVDIDNAFLNGDLESILQTTTPQWLMMSLQSCGGKNAYTKFEGDSSGY